MFPASFASLSLSLSHAFFLSIYLSLVGAYCVLFHAKRGTRMLVAKNILIMFKRVTKDYKVYRLIFWGSPELQDVYY